MRRFFLRHRGLHLWLLTALAALLCTWLLRGSRPLMNALAARAITPLRTALGNLTSHTDVSVMEVLCILAVPAVLGWLIRGAVSVIRSPGRRGERIYRLCLTAACAGLSLYVLFWCLWGVYFWTDSFQDRSGIRARPVAVEELAPVTRYFAERLAETAPLVPRDSEGRFDVSWQEILERSPDVYRGVEAEFPFLQYEDRRVKAVYFSRVMSLMDFTGFYCAYTGESNVNVDSPACLLPATVAHELGHQRGYASEQECNFLAVLASTKSGDPAYAYSGWLLGYIYLGNALYGADPDAYWAIRDALPETVLADLRWNNAYWDQFRDSVAKTVSNKVYDGMLKAYGDERGIQSYGTVVDLLVVYWTEHSHGGTLF